MIIRKVEIEEGFLDGSSIEFGSGLNVIIGPRGVGKTSLIELLRFGLGVAGYTDRSNDSSVAHARSVLGEGRVTVIVEDQGESLTVVRSAHEDAPRVVGSSQIVKPIILSQNEVEQIGLEATSRMRLLDGFRPSVTSVTVAEDSALAMIASFTAEIQTTARAARSVEERVASMADVEAALEEARRRESEISASVVASEPQRLRLAELSSEGATLELRRGSLERSRQEVEGWLGALDQVRTRAPDFEFSMGIGDRAEIDRLASAIRTAITSLDSVARLLQAPMQEIQEATTWVQKRLVQVQDEARDLRRSVEALAEGAGKASQEVARLQTQLAQLGVLAEEALQLRKKVQVLRQQRSQRLQDLEVARERRFAERKAAADRINKALGPIIHVRVDRDGGLGPYVNAIAELLQGSGLHYNSLAPSLAERVSPREFVEAVELGGVAELASIAGLTEDRAIRVIASADKRDLQRVLTAPIDDRVEITLLDESVPKPTQELSTGQRCTTVLPILLLHDERVLVLDQPEDHLDNGYVVQTLVRSIRDRSAGSQTIVATHNANIPVLGEASRVILLGSDGQKGFQRLAAPLTSPDVVSAISQVMEGGAEAFKLRAEFYAKHLG